jgi:hypothetical protein
MGSWKPQFHSLKVRLSLSILAVGLIILWSVTLYGYQSANTYGL